MNRPLLLAAVAASLALPGCAADRTASEAAATGDMTPTAREAYVGMAAASDMFEIQSSQIARTRGQAQAVKDFAQMMIDHHTQTTAQLTAAARAAGVTPPMPALLPMQSRMMKELEAAAGADFDRIYLRQQVEAHEMALALHGNYARGGDAPALRAVASAATPVVQQHLDRARQLAGG